MFSNDIGMEFGMKKCGVLKLKRGKIVESEGIQLINGETMKEVGEEGYTYLGILELDKIKEDEMKVAIQKEYKRRLRLVLKSKLNGRNKISAVNTWAVAIFRYGAGVIQWRENELKDLDRKTRKMLTMYGAFHPKSDVDRLYVKRKKGGRGLISVERCVKEEENSLKLYVAKSEEKLIKGVAQFEKLQESDLVGKKELKARNEQEGQEKWRGKKLHGQFARELSEATDKDKTWQWLSKADLKVGTEALICAAQEQSLRTNYVKYHIDKTVESPLCRLCGQKGESVQHIISACEKLAQKEYKRRHDNVARKIHWDISRKNGLECKDKWYEHEPEGVVENEDVKLLWDVMIQCDNMIEARRPDIVLTDKKEHVAMIIDIAVPADENVDRKEKEKVDKYQDLKREIKRLWKLKKVEVVPVVIGSLGSVTKGFEKWIQKLEIPCDVGVLQKTALLGTARILRKVLEL